MEMKTMIKCGMLFSAVDESVQKDVAIIVEGNRIEKICPVSEADSTDATILDLSDKFVMPGLIDGHVHVSMNGEANSMAEMPFLKLGDVAYRAMHYVNADLMAGFTTIRCEGDPGFVDISLRDAIAKGLVVGPRMQCSGIALSSTGGHGDYHFSPDIKGGEFSAICNSPDQTRAAARYTFKHGADQVKLMATGGVMSKGDDPGACEMTVEEMKAACEVARFRGKTSSAHAHGAEGIKNAIRAGITSIEHGMLIDEEGIEMLVEHGTYLVPTIIAAYRIIQYGKEAGIPDYAVEKAKICLKNHADHLKVMVKKGVKIAFGTDTGTPYSHHGEQAFEFQLMLESGIPAAYCLQAATKVNAALIRREEELGTIEVGKLADIVAFCGNPLEDGMKSMMNCCFVMKDGVVYKG